MKSLYSLQGLRVLITRAEDRAKTLVDAIASGGGTAILLPTIAIVGPKDPVALIEIYNHLNNFDIAIFVSPNAINKTLALKHMRVIAIGPGTRDALHRYSIVVDEMPTQDFSTEGLLELPILQKVFAKRIVIFCGEGGRVELAEILRQRGANVTLAYVYCRLCPTLNVREQLQNWRENGLDLVVGTSGESIYNLLKMVGELGAAWLKQLPWLVVSQRMAALTKDMGFVISPIIADNATNEAIFRALIRSKQAGILCKTK